MRNHSRSVVTVLAAAALVVGGLGACTPSRSSSDSSSESSAETTAETSTETSSSDELVPGALETNNDTLTGETMTTENGNVVAVFTIESDGFTDKEYYIIGDNEYVPVHVTAFSDMEATDAAAQQIVDSFEWPNEG